MPTNTSVFAQLLHAYLYGVSMITVFVLSVGNSELTSQFFQHPSHNETLTLLTLGESQN